ncbi:MAG: hypothetical protein AAFU60_08740 [Bacteroidota bacterium]
MNKDLKSIFGSVTGLDEKSVQFLTSALAKNNLPGFDYLEFKQSLANLASMNIDEETSFKSAFATATTVGLTKENLLTSAAHYKKVLDQEKRQFDSALEKQMQQKVASKKSEVEKLKAQVEQYREKIRDLEAKIAKAEGTIANADDHIQASLEKIQTTHDNFAFTFQSILNQIEKDIDSINTYL